MANSENAHDVPANVGRASALKTAMFLATAVVCGALFSRSGFLGESGFGDAPISDWKTWASVIGVVAGISAAGVVVNSVASKLLASIFVWVTGEAGWLAIGAFTKLCIVWCGAMLMGACTAAWLWR